MTAADGARPPVRHDLSELERQPRGDEAVAPVGDVAEWAAVHEGRRAVERLDEVGLDRVLHEDGHRARGPELARRDQRPVAPVGHHDALHPRLEVLKVARQAENRRLLAELIHGDEAVRRSAQTDHEAAQRAIVHVEHALPENPPAVDPEGIALGEMVVEHRR